MNYKDSIVKSVDNGWIKKLERNQFFDVRCKQYYSYVYYPGLRLKFSPSETVKLILNDCHMLTVYVCFL